MIKPIMTDTLFLAQKSQDADRSDLYLAQDLEDTLNVHRNTCVGMAANMIGVCKRVIIIDMGFTNLVMFNPILEDYSEPYETEESCLSLSDSRKTKRYDKIKVSYRDRNWQKQILTLQGMTAQICQHELDHLEGVII